MNRRFVSTIGLSLLSSLPLPLAAAPVINEIMYRPGTSYPENIALEFIEIHNPDSTAVDISGWALTEGIDYTFPSGTTIAAGGYIVVAADPSTLASSGGYSGAFGPWDGKLSNNGETITLSQPDADSDSGFSAVDSVDYADEGDWATRMRDSLGGWSWVSTANSGGRSLERRNPALAVDNGQNWGASSATGGSPGAANSLLASNVAPVITKVKHFPAVPTSSDTVTISCQLADESDSSALSATVYWRNATSTSAGSFQAVAMTGDGSGYFSAALGALANKQIVEFYVSATDGTNTRTWPALSSEGQNTNCTYQVDNEMVSGPSPVYRLILTAAENSAFTNVNTSSNRQFNVTLVATRGADTTIRYLCAMRIRGNSSRQYTIKPLRFHLPSDNKWDGIDTFLIGPRSAPLQYLAQTMQRAAGLVAGNVSPIEVRRQGVEYTVSSGTTADYGKLVRVEAFDADYLDSHFSGAVTSQIYRKISVTGWSAASTTAPSNPDSTWSGWSKESNSGANDWSDVINFSRAWQNLAASHFTGETTGNVASGTWNGTAFTDAELETLSTVVDLDYLARWLAVMTVIPNNEPNLSTGEDDDYAGAFISDGTNTRFYPLPHDMDTTFGLGENSFPYNISGLYDATETDTTTQRSYRQGVGNVTLMAPLLPLLGNSSHAGNATFRTRYLTAIRELFGSIFDADISSGSNPPFHQFVDNHLGDWVPSSTRTTIKTFMTNRQSYLLGLIGAAKITPTDGTSTSTRSADSTPTLRINEVLTNNTSTLLNGTTYPDVIELYNSDASSLDLTGMQLTDYDGETYYTFPSGTTLAAGGFLTVFADSDTSAAGLHTGFALDSEGDAVRLYDSVANGGALIDSIEFGFQIADRSIARTASAPGTWALTAPTLGAANGSALTLGDVDDVVINEWAGAIKIRTDKDFIELYNPSTSPVALGGVRVTDDLLNQPSRYDFRRLSFIAAGGHLVLDTDKLEYGLDGDFDHVFLVGANDAIIDRIDFASQPEDHSTGRATDGATSWTDFTVPTPGLANNTSLPSAYQTLLNSLRVTEIMYKPVAASSAGDYEFIELQNVGTTTLDLSGVRFTNGIDYTFEAGTTLAPNAYVVVCKKRSAFISRYPSSEPMLAAGNYTGALDNSGETLALTLPSPWDVHILKFRYEPDWYPTTASEGYSLVTVDPATTAARDWDERSTWTVSSTVNGNPGGLIETLPIISSAAEAAGTVGEVFSYQIVASASPTSYGASNLPSGLNIDSVSGAITGTPVQGGTFAVTISATNASGTTAGSLAVTIAKAVATVLIGDTQATYDGTVKTVSTSTSPEGLAVVVTYDGSLSGPIDAGVYEVLAVVDDAGYDGSAEGTLEILPTVSTEGNASMTATAGVSGALSVSVAGGSGVTVQWQVLRDGVWVDIEGATSSSLSVASVQAFNAGTYRAVLSAGGTDVISDEITVQVDAPAASDARLQNLSTRALCQTGDDVLIPGFVISGTGTKRLLLRASGPELVPMGVEDVLTDPQMVLRRQSDSEVLGSNDDWGDNANAADIVTAAASVWAFAFEEGSASSALLVDLPAGTYTLVCSGKGSAAGVAIAEVYDISGTSTDARLVNISNRGYVGVGGEVMIPGFIVSEEGSRTFLIRAVGPTLGAEPFNVAGTIADPVLRIFDGDGANILTNDNWGENGDAADVSATAASVYAFALQAGSADAAFVVTLPPGAYTVQASGVGETTGVALVEVYLIPN